MESYRHFNAILIHSFPTPVCQLMFASAFHRLWTGFHFSLLDDLRTRFPALRVCPYPLYLRLRIVICMLSYTSLDSRYIQLHGTVIVITIVKHVLRP